MARQLIALLVLVFSTMTAQAASQFYYIHTDHLGTPQVVTDSNQAVVWEGRQMPFGELHSQQGAITQPLRFPGQYADQETGFRYNYFRDYDPALGRYIQSDPIGLGGGINTFAYVEGNPLQSADPKGLVKWSGSSFTASAGFGSLAKGVTIYQLSSECVNGKQVLVRVEVDHTSATKGPSWLSYYGNNLEIDDGKESIDTSGFHGPYYSVGIGVAGGFGGSYSVYSFNKGEVTGHGGSFDVGINFSVGQTYGNSKVAWEKTMECSCDE